MTRSGGTRKRRNAGGIDWRCGKKRWRSGASLASVVRRSLVHVLDVGLEDEEVGSAVAVDLQASLVVPLDGAFQRLSILQHEDHGRLGLHLLHVVEIFRVGL